MADVKHINVASRGQMMVGYENQDESTLTLQDKPITPLPVHFTIFLKGQGGVVEDLLPGGLGV